MWGGGVVRGCLFLDCTGAGKWARVGPQELESKLGDMPMETWNGTDVIAATHINVVEKITAGLSVVILPDC